MIRKEVPFEGPMDARIYLVGEAPGQQEVKEGKPFCGGAGRILNRLLTDAGILRTSCRVGNLCKVRPPSNDFTWFQTSEEGRVWLEKGLKELNEDVCKVKPNVIVPLGNHPLHFFTGLTGITNRRGSIYWSEAYQCKVIPTIHPASIMRHWDYAPLTLFDLKRVREESESKVYDVPNRTVVVEPSFEKVCKELERMKGVKRVAFDIETAFNEEGSSMSCIAFADSPTHALTIPFQLRDGTPYFRPEEELQVLTSIKQLLESDVEKVAHNAQFDVGFLRHKFNFKVNNLVLDTMCAQHTLYPELPKDLGLVCSIFTKQPYYKDMVTGADLTFWRYNGLDACVTFEIAEKIEAEMKEFGVWKFYKKLVHPLIPILLDMQLRGVKVDGELKRKASEEVEKRIEKAQAELNKLTGMPINVNSPKQLKELFYRRMNLPSKTRRGTGKETVNEEAIQELAATHPHPIFDLVLEVRKWKKLKSTYLDTPLRRGRMHTSYTIGGRLKDGKVVSAPETGRLSSSKSLILQTGSNLQNIPRGECRRMFVPDEGKVMMSVDLSQAELRVVAYLSREKKLIQAFESGEDVFKRVGSWIYNKKVEEVSDEERSIAKRMTHALNYGMGVHTFKVYAGVPYQEAKHLIEKYFDTFSGIRMWQLNVERELARSRVMVTPMGRKRQFFGRKGPQLLREALAYVPQSTVADVLNYAMVQTSHGLEGCGIDAQLLLQVHDEFVLQCKEVDVERVKEIVKRAFDIPLNINGRVLTIPIKVKIGKNWEDMEEVRV